MMQRRRWMAPPKKTMPIELRFFVGWGGTGSHAAQDGLKFTM